jgi:SOS-response transcriptional repressor LexA
LLFSMFRKQRLIRLGSENRNYNSILQGNRCMIVGRKVYFYGEVSDLR